jgi:hypothetical protein
LTALVGTAISENAVDADEDFPLVVYAIRADSDVGLDGSNLGDRAEITVQCWGDDSASAVAVADAVRGAVATVPNSAIVIDEQGSFDPELKKHAQVITVIWMQ